MAARIGTAGFIGRERELAELEASLLDAEGAAPRLALLAGDSGVGKSRLLGEFSRRARVLGARVLDGESVELGEDELPYAPLVAALRPLARAGDPVFDELPAATLTELATLAPELGPVAGARAGESGGQAQLRLFEAILALLAKLGERGSV
ncbi:MAG: ATP-binding protein, partial [Solirubrobacterales bacterium]|nr:ATP-binding protein [Solirubrobacterales bacterium]